MKPGPKPNQNAAAIAARKLITRRIRNREADRTRCLANYYRRKTTHEPRPRKPITAEQKVRFSLQRIQKAGRDRAYEASRKDLLAAELTAAGHSIVSIHTAKTDDTWWSGPGMHHERELTRQADNFLRLQGWTPQLRPTTKSPQGHRSKDTPRNDTPRKDTPRKDTATHA